ncbi:MAG: S24 family peptidase [Bacteroidota bacterium]
MQGQILKKLIKEKGYRQEDFADLMGVSRSYLLTLMDKSLIKEKYLQKASEILNVATNVFTPTESETKRGVPVYNVDFTASDVTQFDDESEKVVGYVDLDGFRRCKFIVRVKGSSMEPDFKSGDFIGLEPVDDFSIIEFGQPYAITTKSKQKLVKQIRKGIDSDNLILRSKNPEFDDIDIHKKQIDKLFKVHGPIRDQWQ